MECKECNNELNDEDIKSIWETRGERGFKEQIVVGYHCSNCGYKEVF